MEPEGGNEVDGPEQHSMAKPLVCKRQDDCPRDTPMCCKQMQGIDGGTGSMNAGGEQPFPAQCKKECAPEEKEVDGMEPEGGNEVDGPEQHSMEKPLVCKRQDDCPRDTPMCCKQMQGIEGGTGSMNAGGEQPFPPQCKKECAPEEKEVDGIEPEGGNEVDGPEQHSMEKPLVCKRRDDCPPDAQMC